MKKVIGIDAAWSARNPSGVALIEGANTNWTLKGVFPSYGSFLGVSQVDGGTEPAEHLADSLARDFANREIALIAVDMPLSNAPIVCRRVSDNAVSSAYGARKCSTHTPNPDRPGQVGVRFHNALKRAGFSLSTTLLSLPGIVEVYPHPAIVELTGARERLPYKLANIRKYWPTLTTEERRQALLKVWASIIAALDEEIDGVGAQLALPSPDASVKVLKGFEDCLDAVVCAWVGKCCLEGRARPFGDEVSAIWIPTPRYPSETPS